MAVVRTINGDVSPDTLGVVNAHDHLIRVGAGEVYIDPDHLLDDVDKAAQEATYFVEASKNWANGGTIIDMCPASSGRGVLKTLEVVEKVPDLQVVQATGFHQQKVYLEWRQSWVNQYTVNQIADLLIADIVEGIDRFDYMGPIVERTNVKAGVIKWATAYGKITEWEKKSGKAVAIASKETGCPINTHVTAGTCGPDQARFLVDQGVDPTKIAIGHMQRNWDPWVHEQICKLGCYVELDGTNRIKYVPDNTRVNLVKTLGEKGYGKQILLGTDSGKASYQKVYGSVSGIDYDPAVFCPRLVEDEGVDRDYVTDLLINNAAAFFGFEPLAGCRRCHDFKLLLTPMTCRRPSLRWLRCPTRSTSSSAELFSSSLREWVRCVPFGPPTLTRPSSPTFASLKLGRRSPGCASTQAPTSSPASLGHP